MMTKRVRQICAVGLVLAGLTPASGLARDPAQRIVIDSGTPFAVATENLVASIRAHQMGLVARANAQNGAASQGVTIPGNQVFMVFRPDFAVRMLAADPEAGFEAPIRIYVTENDDGSARISYIRPSDVFAGYDNQALAEMAKELDPIFDAIVRDAAR